MHVVVSLTHPVAYCTVIFVCCVTPQSIVCFAELVVPNGVQRYGDVQCDCLILCLLPNSSIEQWCIVVIVTGYTLFVTSQYEVIFTFANQHFGEVCWRDMHINLHTLFTRCTMCHWNKYKSSTLQVRRPEQNTALNAKTAQFITAKISGNTLEQGSRTHLLRLHGQFCVVSLPYMDNEWSGSESDLLSRQPERAILLRLHVKRQSPKTRQPVLTSLYRSVYIVWKSFTCSRRVGEHLLCRLVNKGLYGVGKHAHWLQISQSWQLLFMPVMKLVPWTMDRAAHCKIHP